MAQWIKASDYGSEDWEFESSWAHHKKSIERKALIEISEVLFFVYRIENNTQNLVLKLSLRLRGGKSLTCSEDVHIRKTIMK